MRYNKIKTIFLMSAFICASFNVAPTTASSFTGSGDKTTATFSIVKYAKIDWRFTRESDYSYFDTYLYEQGATKYSDYKFDFGENESGTTYLYESGSYYFNVTASNIVSWTINATETNGEYLSDHDSITGIYSTNTKLFKSYGNTKINWTTIKANDYDIFFVYIYEPRTLNYAGNFHDGNGSITFTKTGEYYLNILCANLASYTINLDVTNPNETSTTSTSTTTTSTTVTTSTSSATTSTTSITTKGIAGFSYISIIVPVCTVVLVKSYKRNKKE